MSATVVTLAERARRIKAAHRAETAELNAALAAVHGECRSLRRELAETDGSSVD